MNTKKLFILIIGISLSIKPSETAINSSNLAKTLIGAGLIAGGGMCIYKGIRYIKAMQRKQRADKKSLDIEELNAGYEQLKIKYGQIAKRFNEYYDILDTLPLMNHITERDTSSRQSENEASFLQRVRTACGQISAESSADYINKDSLINNTSHYFRHHRKVVYRDPRTQLGLMVKLPSDSSSELERAQHFFDTIVVSSSRIYKIKDDIEKGKVAIETTIGINAEIGSKLFQTNKPKEPTKYRNKALLASTIGFAGLASGLALIWPRKAQ